VADETTIEPSAEGGLQDGSSPDLTCQTRPMRMLGSLLNVVAWRAGLARSGVRLRLRSLLSVVMILGGLGAAIGYAVVGRLERALDDDDETPSSQE